MTSMPSIDPRTLFPEFYGNSAIRLVAGATRWTVSGRLGAGDGTDGRDTYKAPIDMRHLLATGRTRGARVPDKTCLVTLGELTDRLPAAANAAFFVRAQIDGLLVVDIEPDCPPEVSRRLLAMPGIRYAEVSMSGRGYHLLMEIPESFDDYPDAANSRVLREEHGWYELLLDHWVTFTRRPIPARAGEQDDSITLEEIYAELAVAQAAKPSGGSGSVPTGDEVPEIAGADEIVERTIDGARERFKTPGDFGGDMSRFEFSVLGVLHREMRKHVSRIGFLKRTRYSDSDEAWLLYMAVGKVLEPRAKHLERRNGRPFLLDRAAAMVAANR